MTHNILHTLSLSYVAQRLGRSASWWNRMWRTYVEQHNFPAPLHNSKPFVWDSKDVEAWVKTRGMGAQASLAPANDTYADEVEAWRMKLEEQHCQQTEFAE